MGIKTKLAIKDIQVTLKELGLYSSKIDGIWGKRTADGLSTICGNYNLHNHNGTAKLSLISPTDQVAGLKGLQANLYLLGLYLGRLDGLFGEDSFKGLRKTAESYRDVCQIKPLDIAWSAEVSPVFVHKVKDWVEKRGYFEGADSALMSCMAFESGGTFSPSIQNGAGAQAFGLIQFMKGSATDLGVPLEKIREMTQLDQLDLVFKYFEMWEGRGKKFMHLQDFYMTIFYPKAVGYEADHILFRSDVIQYRQNIGFDFNKDGIITVGEIASRLYDKYYEGMDPSKRTLLVS